MPQVLHLALGGLALPGFSLSGLFGRWWIWLVYSAGDALPAPKPHMDTRVRPLAPDELLDLAALGTDFGRRQADRLERFGASYAFGVFVGEELGHVAWLLPPEAARRDVPHVLELDEGEAEITACETVPAFRGRGLYPFAIRSLIATARERGCHRVYVKAGVENKASRAGIRKAGLERELVIAVWHPPWGGEQRQFRLGPSRPRTTT